MTVISDESAQGGTVSAPEQPCLVVAIGASAGGQAALEQFFTAIPDDCLVCYVVIMHIPPEGPSFLADMLARYTTMKVLTAEQGMPLVPNSVVVIPAGKELTVSGGCLQLQTPPGAYTVRHPVDRFFQSLAVEMKERAMAVVLSGFGMDGSAGVLAIKEAGGTVLVQDPATALTPAMPENAIATGAADHVLSAEEMPARITTIVCSSCSLPATACRLSTADEELLSILALVRERTGHDFSSYKRNTVIRRVERRMAINEAGSLKKYIDLLKGNELEAEALGKEILIGVTSFFRDPEAFEALRRDIIPRLLAGRRGDHPVRIWHACCASGEEVYSVAILVREYLDEVHSPARVQVFATDLDDAAIAQARAGLYDDEVVAEVGAQRLARFFTRSNGRWQVAKELREMVVFAHHSVIKDPPFSKLDLLVCRNFLIYLNPDMQKRLMSMFHLVLNPKGVLFLGASETVGRHSDLFTPLDQKWKLFERRETSRRDDPFFPLNYSTRRSGAPGWEPRGNAAPVPEPGREADRLLAELYAPPSVVVNEKYEVVHVSSGASRFLALPPGAPTLDILKMVGEELRPALRAALYKSFSDGEEVCFKGVTLQNRGDEGRVTLRVRPFPSDGSTLALVVLEPLPAPAPLAPGAPQGDAGDESSREALVRQLEEQLRITHEQLLVTTEQLETSREGFLSANEEMMSINEEFQSANEELQSTNEELETSKEELQALNEELVTVNAELHGKVEELDRANSDMENLLASSAIAAVFLDRALQIKRFTPAAAAILNLIPADVGRPFRHLAGTVDWPELSADALSVLQGELPVEREVAGVDNGRHYLVAIRPYIVVSGEVDGVVVTLVDITDHKRLEARTLHLASFPELNPNPVLEVDFYGRVIFANPASRAVLEELGLPPEEYSLLLPADLATTVQNWDRAGKSVSYREVALRDRVFGESIFLSPQLRQARIYALDITELKRSEEAHARLAAIVEYSDDAIIAKDLEGTIRSWNSGAERLFGYTPEEAVGEPITILIPEELLLEEQEILRRVIAGERIDHFETVRLTKNGKRVEVSVTVSPVKDGEGRVIGVSKIARDIGERKKAEEVIRRQVEELKARNDELTRFTKATVGREFRMIELKREINELCQQGGLPTRYRTDFEEK